MTRSPDRPIVRSPDSDGAITRSPDRQILGLYVHIPFCSAICNYCNFNRGLFDPDLKIRYVDALISEIGQQRGRPFLADTIYFGGGTPSLLEPDEVARIIQACDEHFHVSPDREVTLEAN